jgi:DNA adenine methylase
MLSIPHPIPYQGSKRLLARVILSFAPRRFFRLIEPFAGSAAVTLAAASRDTAQHYVIGDGLEPLVNLWKEILNSPESIASNYDFIWRAQEGRSAEHYLEMRDRFNQRGEPAYLLYLLARCVKNSVRFNRGGQFNQSADHRRKGMHPVRMRNNIRAAAALLSGRTEVRCADFSETIDDAHNEDLIYLDPPYQGVSKSRDPRYYKQVTLENLATQLERLNARDICYLLSYDGSCGEKSYGTPLPAELGLKRVSIEVGVSAQSTLAGRRERTVESLYLSPAFAKIARPISVSSSTRYNPPEFAPCTSYPPYPPEVFDTSHRRD